MSNLKAESLQSATPATQPDCAATEKTITISAAKYAALLREYRRLVVSFRRRADDIKRDTGILLDDLDRQLDDLAKLN